MSKLAHQSEFNQAERRALQQYLAELPKPADFAHVLPLKIARILMNAYAGGGGLRVIEERDAAQLRRYGLCEYGGRFLTNFGAAVRRTLLEGEA